LQQLPQAVQSKEKFIDRAHPIFASSIDLFSIVFIVIRYEIRPNFWRAGKPCAGNNYWRILQFQISVADCGLETRKKYSAPNQRINYLPINLSTKK
jgi:hypothetical protein